MRVLVIGTVPPPGGDGARRLAEVIVDLVAQGHDVEVLSPDGRSAAHRHARLNGPLLAVHVAMFAKRYDALVLRIETNIPLHSQAGRMARTTSLATLGESLRLWNDVTIRIDSPMPVPGGIGGRATRSLWSRATRIVVANEADKEALLRAPGVDEDRVFVELPTCTNGTDEDRGWAVDLDGPLREEVLGLVRARAARERAFNSARIELGASGLGPDGANAFSAVDWPTSTALGLARIAFGKVVRVVRALQAKQNH